MGQGIDNFASLREACAKYGVEPLNLPALLQRVRHDAWAEGEQAGWKACFNHGEATNPYDGH